jgi:hypothetical protein
VNVELVSDSFHIREGMMSKIQESRVETPNKSVPWYTEEIHDLSPAARELLENYSKVSPNRVISHILMIVSI